MTCAGQRRRPRTRALPQKTYPRPHERPPRLYKMLTLYGVSITTENAQHILASLFVDGARATARRSRGDDRSRPLCEHAFVMSQGSARIRYQRSIQARNVFLAETAAFEMRTLSLEDALQLV